MHRFVTRINKLPVNLQTTSQLEAWNMICMFKDSNEWVNTTESKIKQSSKPAPIRSIYILQTLTSCVNIRRRFAVTRKFMNELTACVHAMPTPPPPTPCLMMRVKCSKYNLITQRDSTDLNFRAVYCRCFLLFGTCIALYLPQVSLKYGVWSIDMYNNCITSTSTHEK